MDNSRIGVAVSACALVCASCTTSVREAPHASARTAVSTVMSRHVQNATEAASGDLEAKALRQRLAASPGDLDARVLLARMYARRGLTDVALEHYRLAAAQFPDSLIVAIEMAKLLREMGAGEEALKAIATALDRRPQGNPQLLSLRGILLDERGKFAEAEAAHRAALALDEGRSSLHNNLGYNLLLQGRAEAAADEFRRALEIDSRSAIARNNLGTALAAQKQAEQARAIWQQSGDPAVAHNNLAAVLIEQGQYPDARAELSAALGFRRDFPEALANLKLVSEQDGQPAAVEPSAQHVNFWKRFTSSLRSGGAKHDRKTAAAGASAPSQLAAGAAQ
jgi:Flp pilus assembly protein TadD